MSVKSSLSSFLKILSSYNSNVLLAALVFLLLVVLFVLLLHFYARFFWSPSHQDFSAAARSRRRRRRNRRRTVTTTRIIPSLPLRGFDGGVNAPATAATSDDKGLDSSVISSIPLFVYEENEEEEEEEEEECVICLGLWEAGDFGRKLRNCGHGFHVECIDMWLSSHSTCPLCRSPVLAAASNEDNLKPAVNAVEEAAEVRLQIFPTGEDENNSDRRVSMSLAVMEDVLKTGDDDGEEEVRIEVFDDDEEINGGGSRSDRRRSMSMTSSTSSSLMKMLSSSSSRSERNKVFPTARQDSSK
ncbi:Zinc finger RING-type [Arabidopsis suecica]|uniref:RING-type E3 ubiquitin transferase n=1 Tax=Arabidopsis suecica TaxID=45249 RepID=A0A8T1Y0Q7_ARASU|nr:Zinc finger RING-type [Arabidopsis suecica]